MPKQGLAEKEQIDGRLFQIQEIERVLGERRRDAQRELDYSERDIVSAQKRNDPETLKKEAFAQHPVYKEASEIFQWIVNGEGQAALTYGEIQAVGANGQEQTLMKYNRPEPILNVAAQAQESKIMSKLDNALKHLLSLESSEIRLKWVFDHVRNYALAAAVMAAGFYLFKHGASVNTWPGAGYVFGTLLVLCGFLLLILNIAQPIWAMAKQTSRMLPYMIVSLVIFFGAIEFFWVAIKRSQF